MNTKEMQEYAWGWFEYHAGQRLVAFRFFLVFLGVLVLGLGNSLKDRNLFLVSAISTAAAFVAFAFLMLEFRNEDLVEIGRVALRKLEDSEEFRQAPSDLKLFHADKQRSLIVSHKLWFRIIYVVCIVVFLFLAFKPTTVLPETPGNSASSQIWIPIHASLLTVEAT